MSARGARARVATPAERAATRARSAPARRPAPRVVARPARPRLRAGWWPVPVIALMLGGIVWINVSKLALTTQTSALVQETRQVEGETVLLNAELGQRDNEVTDRAKAELGMIDAPGKDVIYLAAPKHPTLP